LNGLDSATAKANVPGELPSRGDEVAA
jgi:hypothetical protein